jgi:serine/threonine protein kinase
MGERVLTLGRRRGWPSGRPPTLVIPRHRLPRGGKNGRRVVLERTKGVVHKYSNSPTEAHLLEKIGANGIPSVERLVRATRKATEFHCEVEYVANACTLGSVFNRLRLGRGEVPSRRTTFVALFKVAVAIRRIHAMGIVHGDIHADNIMVSMDGEGTLIDFECGRDLEARSVEFLDTASKPSDWKAFYALLLRTRMMFDASASRRDPPRQPNVK